MRRLTRAVLPLLAAVLFLPASAYAQVGSIAGTVRDQSGGALPGVTVEVTSPALIEKVRSTVSDSSGRYQITNLPIGTYTVTFTLQGFSVVRRENILLTSDFVAPVNPQLAVGSITETVEVVAEAPTVDVQSARTVTTFSGEDLRELPTARNPSSILQLVPGITATGNAGNYGQGICSGGAGVWCTPHINNFNAHTSTLDNDGLAQGRLLIDGVPINTGSAGQITGAIGGYVADIANAQEVTIQLSGALGESETGGTAINIIPRTGGNRFAGNYFTSYTQDKWFDRNIAGFVGKIPGWDGDPLDPDSPLQNSVIIHDHDISATFGGPILRDRLWFHLSGRTQGKEASQNGGPFYYNLNAGKWGANYQPDYARGPVTYTNMWRNASARITYQATQKNKFNIFWDEQDSCQDPCDGTVAAWVSPESWWSVATRPNTLNQVTWTNPLTNRLLLEANLTSTRQHYDFTRHRYVDNPQHIPRVAEFGERSGSNFDDPTDGPVNSSAQIFGATSGSIYSSTLENADNWRTRASASYITGSHNAKVGYELQWYSNIEHDVFNQPRLSYRYDTPDEDCALDLSCGNASLYYPQDPNNLARRPVPSEFTINVGDRAYDEKVWTNSMYIQDQWTINRLTLNGAVRYDNAQSKYGETCVGPDRWVTTGYCVEPTDGVNFHNVTPRWGVAWDVFGDGRTAVKWNMGKYLQAARIGQGIYTDQNPARRTQNSLEYELWNDLNGDRVPNCDFTRSDNHTVPGGDECGDVDAADFAAFGIDPYVLDQTGFNSFDSVYCGQAQQYPDQPIPAELNAYCNQAGQNLLSGWDKRRSEWQLGLGIQRELLPRLSGEVTYNHRWYQNFELGDSVGDGCDLYQSGTQQCIDDLFNGYISEDYDFYSIRAPLHPELPDGGGYLIHGLDNRATSAPTADFGTATTLTQYQYEFQAVDTNFIWRAPGGLRINGGTSTGRSIRNTCDSLSVADAPGIRTTEYNNRPECDVYRPFQTNVRGTISYTTPGIPIPVVGQVFGDWLVSTVFQSRPGVEISANYTLPRSDAIFWHENSAADRAAACAISPTTGLRPAFGCLNGGGFFGQTPSIDLLDSSDMWGERITLFDLKLAKNIRFAGKRVNFGLDIYNLFNSDAIVDYVSTFNPTDVDGNPWLAPNLLVAPRFTRVQVQFEF